MTDNIYFDICPNIPSAPGNYLLRIDLAYAVCHEVGKLGKISFLPGSYVYAGSAFGPGGLRARLSHHLRPVIRPHWHIDWLHQLAPVRSIWYCAAQAHLECVWNQALLQVPGASIPFPGFGASDCPNNCRAHLVVFPGGVDVGQVTGQISKVSGANRVQYLQIRSEYGPNP